MYEFELVSLAGEPGVPGQVLKLYEGQDFAIQLTAAEPYRLLAVANLPMTFQGEFGTGVGIFTLHRVEGGTEVSLTGSRRYTWHGEGPNPLKERRSSADFQAQTKAMWEDRFLARLKALAAKTGP